MLLSIRDVWVTDTSVMVFDGDDEVLEDGWLSLGCLETEVNDDAVVVDCLVDCVLVCKFVDVVCVVFGSGVGSVFGFLVVVVVVVVVSTVVWVVVIGLEITKQNNVKTWKKISNELKTNKHSGINDS